MNTRSLTSWLLILGPIGMFLIWFILDPMVIGEAPEGLSPSETAIASLQLDLDQEALSNVMNMIGGFAFIGIFAGLAMLSRSLQGGGAAFGTLAGILFPAVVAIAVAGFGLSVEAQSHLADGHRDIAATLEITSDGLFGAMPMILGLGLILLGLGIARENGSLPAPLGWVIFIFGIGMMTGMFLDFSGGNPIGMVVWLGWMIITVATGVANLRTSATTT